MGRSLARVDLGAPEYRAAAPVASGHRNGSPTAQGLAHDEIHSNHGLRGEHLLNGFRNRDLRALLFPAAAAASAEEAKRQSGRVTRLIRLLRAHGVIAKVGKTHRYQVTAEGRRQVIALLAARQAGVEQLLKAA